LPLLVLTHGAAWCAGLAGANLGLHLAARRRPGSWLAERTTGGAFEAPRKNYVVTVAGQAIVLPPLWTLSWVLREPSEPWWLGAQAAWPTGEFLAYTSGYFLQDAVVHWADNSPLVALHHLGAILASVAASLTSGWLGLLLTVSMVYELGSLALELGDLGLCPRRLACWLLIASTLVPMAWMVAALCASPPPDVYAWFCVLLALIAGALRVKEVLASLPPLPAAAAKPGASEACGVLRASGDAEESLRRRPIPSSDRRPANVAQ